MKKFYAIFIYWILASIFGNRFIKLSVGGIRTFYILMGCGLMYCFIHYRSIKKILCVSSEGVKFCNSLIVYSLIYLTYLALSSFDFFRKIFDITDVDYGFSYVFRQGYLVFALAIVIMIVHVTVFYYQEVFRFLENYNMLCLSFMIILLARWLGQWDTIPVRSISFALASLLFINRPKKIMSWIAMLLTVFDLISIKMYSSSVIAILVAVLGYIFLDSIIVLTFKKNLSLWFYLFLIVAVMGVGLFYDAFIALLSDDASTMWRWQYWMNELRVLARTKFLGIGFGAAYGSNSIFSEINNASVFVASATEEGTGLFVITQHNSFINMLYRMGILGFVAGVSLFVIRPLEWASRVYMTSQSTTKKLLKWGIINLFFNLIIILMNPGLESPRFAIGFLIPYGILIGVTIFSEYERIINEEEEK